MITVDDLIVDLVFVEDRIRIVSSHTRIQSPGVKVITQRRMLRFRFVIDRMGVNTAVGVVRVGGRRRVFRANT